MSKPLYFFFQSKYQQYFHCFIFCILGPYVFWVSFQQNIVTILISTVFSSVVLIRGETLIRGRRFFRCGYPKVRRLFKCGYSKVRRLLEGGAYLNMDTQRCGAYLNLDTQRCGAYLNVDTQRCGAYLRPGAYKRKYSISQAIT